MLAYSKCNWSICPRLLLSTVSFCPRMAKAPQHEAAYVDLRRTRPHTKEVLILELCALAACAAITAALEPSLPKGVECGILALLCVVAWALTTSGSIVSELHVLWFVSRMFWSVWRGYLCVFTATLCVEAGLLYANICCTPAFLSAVVFGVALVRVKGLFHSQIGRFSVS